MKAAALSGVCSFIKAKHGTTDCSYITVALMLVTDERFVKGGLKDSAIYFFILYTFYICNNICIYHREIFDIGTHVYTYHMYFFLDKTCFACIMYMCSGNTSIQYTMINVI